MIVAITEIIDVISLNSIFSIIQGTLPGSLACPCKICFQCWCSCVQYTNSVSIIGPCLSESLFKETLKLFKRVSFGLASNVHFPKLFVRNVPAEDTLYNIGSVQAIHAVSAHITYLTIYHLTGTIVDFLSSVHTELQICHKVVERVKLIFYLINKLG